MKIDNPYFAIATFCLFFSNIPTVQAANEIQSHESILATAKSFAENLARQKYTSGKITVKTKQLDRRLRLAKCSKSLEAFSSPNTRTAGNTTVGIRCQGDKYWKLYVPVSIRIMKKVVLLKQPVNRKEPLRRSNLLLAEKNISDLHRGYYSKIEPLLGKLALRPLQAGTVITPASITNPLAIKKGSAVIILANLNGLKVRMKGKALTSGSTGDWVTVQNASSKRKIEGKVLSSGVVQVTL